MSLNDLSDKKAVIKAITEFDRIGQEKFLQKYGFGQARSYFLLYNEKEYASKAIVGAAHGYQFDKPLSSYDFGGGERTVKRKLESLGFQVIKLDDRELESSLAEEIPESATEGIKKTITVNRYERSTKARHDCIKHHGSKCTVCGFNFSATYGKAYEGFIHVHHLTPLASIAKAYKVDPVTDLLPVCANCHAAIHHGGKTRTIEEMKRNIRANGQ